ncbi:sensor histidine kinase [Aestuariivivens sediminicola]|uniref:sensor histidine kinase n=1 Tax=Aestuariivivens sediminicola TaxID=2913560 RepID=UPI001F57743C|nr:histidine kinase [Aestuariivivens sediminicola]
MYFQFSMVLNRRHISQVLVHLLFWVLFVVVSLYLFPEYHWRDNPFLQYVSILVVIVYLNHFLLLPFFVKRKWHLLYVLLFVAIAFFATLVYCYSFAQCGCTVFKCLSDYLWQSLVPLIFFSFVWMLYRFLDKQEEFEAVKLEHAEMELKFLKSQINPHVLFNNLNTIYSYALEKPAEAPDLILMLSNNLKHVLYESNEKTISLEKEIEFIDNYIKFQELRTQGVKKIKYTKSIDSFDYEIAPLLLITIIENAFKHSTLNSDITIHIEVHKAVLHFLCKNSFDPLKVSTNALKIGLKNLQKRLELIYKDNYSLKIDKTDLFQVQLNMNL